MSIKSYYRNDGEYTVIEKCNPKQRGVHALVHLVDKNVWCFYYCENSEVDPYDEEFSTLEAAKKRYDDAVAFAKDQPVRPNWEAQAAYDEQWGTDNGYDPRIEQHRREY